MSYVQNSRSQCKDASSSWTLKETLSMWAAHNSNSIV